ncbi:MAG: hypothetical protein U0W24_19385 [Bacteroidales bacterium]
MGTLDDFVKKNAEMFDDELPFGHEKRFLKKLNKKGSNSGLKIWYGIAATFIFLAMLSFFGKDYVVKQQLINENPKILRLSDVSPQYQEVEEFYKAGVESKIIEFEKLNCKINDEQKQMIDNELKQLDVNYRQLQDELVKNKNDERIINAMIDNYQNKIDFLDLVINQIKENCG